MSLPALALQETIDCAIVKTGPLFVLSIPRRQPTGEKTPNDAIISLSQLKLKFI
jgi:hypothetical protein